MALYPVSAMSETSHISNNPLLSQSLSIGKAATTQVHFLRPTLGMTVPDQVVLSAQATQQFYKRAFERYQKRRTAKMTRYGRIALETLQSLMPSVVTMMERPYMEDADIGVITGRSILSLIKEGNNKRPDCVLTSDYMAEMLGLYDETVTMAPVMTTGSEPEIEDRSCLAVDEKRAKTLMAMERALIDLEKAGLIRREVKDQTALLHPFSEKQSGQENLFDWLIVQRRKKIQTMHANPSLQQIREDYAHDLTQFQENRYLMDVMYFSDRDFHRVSGWDILSLIIEGEALMLGALPMQSICSFFESAHEKAVMNAVKDLAEKIKVIDIHTEADPSYIKAKPYATIALNLKSTL